MQVLRRNPAAENTVETYNGIRDKNRCKMAPSKVFLSAIFSVFLSKTSSTLHVFVLHSVISVVCLKSQVAT